jgi:hypothetical protein
VVLVFLLVIAGTAFIKSEFHGNHEHILLYLFSDSISEGPGACIYFSQEQGSPVISLGQWEIGYVFVVLN